MVEKVTLKELRKAERRKEGRVASKKIDVKLWIAVASILVGIISQAVYFGYRIGIMETKVTMAIESLSNTLKDHEQRIRGLERPSRLARRDDEQPSSNRKQR